MGQKCKIIIFDTNVLLTDPHVLLSYPEAEIVLPETVLGELDKLKTARVDPDLRFRGREVSRLLFELAEGQSLIDGITLPDGGSIRVAPFEYNNHALPDGFSTKSPDDKILATAYLAMQEAGENADFCLMTNDLNMLLKAQNLDIPVTQFGNGNDLTFAKKYVIRPFQRYRVPLTILGISLAVFFAIIFVARSMGDFTGTKSTVLSSEFKALLTPAQKDAYDALTALEQNPADNGSLLQMGNFYYARAQANQQSGDRASEIADAKSGITYYERYLGYVPTDADARADMATLYFYQGDTDRAIQEVAKVLEANPNHVNANYNLGMFYLYGRRDLTAASDQMTNTMKLTVNDGNNHAVYEQAKALLAQIVAEQKAGGTSGSGSSTPDVNNTSGTTEAPATN